MSIIDERRVVRTETPPRGPPVRVEAISPAKGPVKPLLVRLRTAQRLLNVSMPTIYELVKRGQLDFVKILRASYVTAASIEALIEQGRHQAPSLDAPQARRRRKREREAAQQHGAPVPDANPPQREAAE
jgi:hypothetical protein